MNNRHFAPTARAQSPWRCRCRHQHFGELPECDRGHGLRRGDGLGHDRADRGSGVLLRNVVDVDVPADETPRSPAFPRGDNECLSKIVPGSRAVSRFRGTSDKRWDSTDGEEPIGDDTAAGKSSHFSSSPSTFCGLVGECQPEASRSAMSFGHSQTLLRSIHSRLS